MEYNTKPEREKANESLWNFTLNNTLVDPLFIQTKTNMKNTTFGVNNDHGTESRLTPLTKCTYNKISIEKTNKTKGENAITLLNFDNMFSEEDIKLLLLLPCVNPKRKEAIVNQKPTEKFDGNNNDSHFVSHLNPNDSKNQEYPYSIADFQDYVNKQRKLAEIFDIRIENLAQLLSEDLDSFGNYMNDNTVNDTINPGIPPSAAALKNHTDMNTVSIEKRRRSGRWSKEEVEYAHALIIEFEKGTLPLVNGTMLRMFIASILNCDSMRVSKKFNNRGPRKHKINTMRIPVFYRRQEVINNMTEDEIQETKNRLVNLENAFFKKIQQPHYSSQFQPVYMGWETFNPKTNTLISIFGESRSEKGGRKRMLTPTNTKPIYKRKL